MRRLLATPISPFIPLLTTAGRIHHPSALSTLPSNKGLGVVPRHPAAAAPPVQCCAVGFQGRARSRAGTVQGWLRQFGPVNVRHPRKARLENWADAALASMNSSFDLDPPPTEAVTFDGPRVLESSPTAAADHIHPTMLHQLQQLQSLPAITTNLQRIGETSFAALFVVAFVQGALALYQYRTNPSGELVVPPGWTVGIEDASEGDDEGEEEEEAQASTQPPSGGQVTSPSKTVDDKRQGVTGSERRLSSPESTGATLEAVANRGPAKSYMKKGWYRVNRYLVVLIPWLARRWDVLLLRYGHLLHVGLIMSLASMFDFRRRHRRIEERFLSEVTTSSSSAPVGDHGGLGEIPNVVVIGDSLACGIGSVDAFDRAKNQTVAIGRIESLPLDRHLRTPDNKSVAVTTYSNPTISEEATAMALGVGQQGGEGGMTANCASYAPITPQSPAPAVESPGGDGIGPVFPRMLARTLSRRWNRPVSWRSAGVDGGTVDDIRRHCIGIVREEAERGRPPDVVVVLCGTNDVKKIFSRQWRTATAPWFRAQLMELIRDIHRIAPRARVVFPALPTYRLDKNSILNVFPLSFFLDTMLGFWDWQKKVVADCSPSNVLYVGLTAVDVYGWYKKEDDNDGNVDDESIADSSDSTTLISADGVHPNSRCYSHWAILVGNSLADALVRGTDDTVRKKRKQAKGKQKASKQW